VRAAELELADDELERLGALAADVHGPRYGTQTREPNWVSPAL
jgi:hypothetical protein